MENCRAPITFYLQKWQKGDHKAGDALVNAVYVELKKISRAYLNRQPNAVAFQTVDLVNEAFVRLVGQKNVQWEDRVHFYGVAARVMRQVLCQAYRRKNAQKRGEGLPTLSLIDDLDFADEKALEIVKLNDALDALEVHDPRKSRLVELRFFTGLDIAECAKVLGVSPSTIKRDWTVAKAWLQRYMTRPVP